jgi:hypothetical protein
MIINTVFCVFNFTLQACRPNFSKFRSPQTGSAGLQQNIITFTNVSTAFCTDNYAVRQNDVFTVLQFGLRHCSTFK